jgi:FKBP-type peptidyl-prolyl cis-trans isomerase SlyD
MAEDMRVEPGMWVTLRYRLFDSGGEPIEEGDRELTYLHGGFGAVFEAIERALAGRAAGERTSLYLEPCDTFGDYDADLLTTAPRRAFPADLQAGMTFEGVPGAGPDGALYTVTDFTDDTVVLDGNHPLAGMALRFDIEIDDVRPATADEVADEIARAGG